MVDIAIIGAGLSGLIAANKLNHISSVEVFEKSRGVSGRMATRNSDPFFFDHGAQYFKIKTDSFRNFLFPMFKDGIIQEWEGVFAEIKNKKIKYLDNTLNNNIRYVGVPGMNSVGKYLANGINIKLNCEIISTIRENNKWCLVDSLGNKSGNFDWIILTAPSHQSLKFIIKESEVHNKVKSIKMNACFSLMLGFDKEIPIKFNAAEVYDEDISWISVNSSKPGRNKEFCLLINSTNKWANSNIEIDKNYALKYLIDKGSDLLKTKLSLASHKVIHRWKFANTESRNKYSFLIDRVNNIAVCGDWLTYSRVEESFTSSNNMVNELINIL